MQQQQMSYGLTRYRSAPSSYFESLLNSNSVGGFGSSDDIDQLFIPRVPSPETRRVLSKFMTGSETIQEQNRSPNISLQPRPKPQSNSQHLPPRIKKPYQQLHRHRSSDYSSISPVVFPSTNPELENSNKDNSYGKPINSVDSAGRVSNSSLIRHNSSPAGIFANIDIEKDFGADINLKTQARQSSGMMTPISEIGNKCTGENSASDQKFGERHGHDSNYLQDFAMDSWDDSSNLFDDFIKQLVDEKPFPSAKSSENQDNVGGNKPTTRLSHHLSLPTSSAELSAIENLLHDSVPLKLRAKRGRATHPRSIAERVRRTKISDRMRKLQEVVPNMEKQTNTSDMLDFAADYIKDLQRQEKKLSDVRAKCSCSARVKL